MTYSDIIVKRITSICKKKHLTVNQLAAMSGMRQSTVNDVLSGTTQNPTLKTLHKIAIGLSMTVSELLDYPEMNEWTFEKDDE